VVPKDIPGPAPLRMRRGMGGWRMGMGFQQGDFGRGRADVSPPAMDKQAPPMAPKDAPGPELLRMRRGMRGGWRPDVLGPEVRQPMPVEPKMD